MSIQRESEAIHTALSTLNSPAKQCGRVFELREGREFPGGPILSFKLCKQGENYTRVLILLFDQCQNAIDPNWTMFDECVERIKFAIEEFWNGTCTESNREVWVHGNWA